MTVRSLLAALILTVSTLAAASPLAVLPALEPRPDVPALKDVVGFDWGEQITDPDQVMRYARALAASSPERVRLVEIGRTLEGRPLSLIVVGSEPNMQALDDLRRRRARLADPRALAPGEAEKLLAELPAVVWIACSVHGDETSGGDAGLALAWALAAGQSSAVRDLLDGAIVVIDAMQNPDGRARFIASNRQASGIAPDPEPDSAEHVQPWPGGRFSHDLFDLNRDWFPLTHEESRARVGAMLEWLPTAVADLHEMGADMAYFFSPPAIPHHPATSAAQIELWNAVGRAIAAAFDEHGVRYWTREIFDSFYPGYGETWPLFTGALGMTFEEASSRGLVTRREDDTLLTYREAVANHLLAAYTTCATVADERARFMRAWYEYRRDAVASGEKGARALRLTGPGGRADALAELLGAQGVEVLRDGPGSLVVPLTQPLSRLARALLEPQAPMGESFEREQTRRESKRLPDEIYDLTAWSLPLLFGVEVKPLSELPSAGLARFEPTRGGSVSGPGRVAFVLDWDGLDAARAAAALLRAGVKVEAAGKPFTIGGRRYGRGSLIIRRAGNVEDLDERVSSVARATGARFFGTDTGFSEEGVDLGSTSVRRLEPVRVALAWDRPTSPTAAGHMRWALERFLGQPVTVIRAQRLGGADLGRFDVLILPDGRGWDAALDPQAIRRIASWVGEGGTLIATEAAAVALTEEKVGLLASASERRGGGAAKPAETASGEGSRKEPKEPFDYERHVIPGDEPPPQVPGAIVRVDLDPDHVLSSGFPTASIAVLVSSNRILTPLTLDKGVNLAVYAGTENLVAAGFVLPASRSQLARKAFAMVQPRGRGRVIAFAEDPALRGITRDAMLLLANAVLLAPAF